MYLYILVYTFFGGEKTNEDVKDIHLGGVKFIKYGNYYYDLLIFDLLNYIKFL